MYLQKKNKKKRSCFKALVIKPSTMLKIHYYELYRPPSFLATAVLKENKYREICLLPVDTKFNDHFK